MQAASSARQLAQAPAHALKTMKLPRWALRVTKPFVWLGAQLARVYRACAALMVLMFTRLWPTGPVPKPVRGAPASCAAASSTPSPQAAPETSEGKAVTQEVPPRALPLAARPRQLAVAAAFPERPTTRARRASFSTFEAASAAAAMALVASVPVQPEEALLAALRARLDEGRIDLAHHKRLEAQLFAAQMDTKRAMERQEAMGRRIATLEEEVGVLDQACHEEAKQRSVAEFAMSALRSKVKAMGRDAEARAAESEARVLDAEARAAEAEAWSDRARGRAPLPRSPSPRLDLADRLARLSLRSPISTEATAADYEEKTFAGQGSGSALAPEATFARPKAPNARLARRAQAANKSGS